MEFTEDQIATLEQWNRDKKRNSKDSGQDEGVTTDYTEEDPDELDFNDHG